MHAKLINKTVMRVGFICWAFSFFEGKNLALGDDMILETVNLWILTVGPRVQLWIPFGAFG